MKIGMAASYADTENGMTMPDMRASKRAADQLNEVIIFRSTGPWSKRWLESKPPYPSKNFHVKGKSSDWGPQAGFVPHNGIYSKVGHDGVAAAKGTTANNKGIADGFAGSQQLRLTLAELERQRDLACEDPARKAIKEIIRIEGRGDLILHCDRPGDHKQFYFLARLREGAFDIFTFEGRAAIPALIIDQFKTGKLDPDKLVPLNVMVSEEEGADRRPMTGDYDLMAICPTYLDYMNVSLTSITKPAIRLNQGITPAHAPQAQMFPAGSRMDKVMDMRLHTGAKTSVDFDTHYDEHGDMGNLTPRILRAINVLNYEMGATGKSGALRRVHHNAESHRNAAFGALTNSDMSKKGDGFPLTAFQPKQALGPGKLLAPFGEAVTIESMGEFWRFAAEVKAAGYYVPKNWTWGMSIRNTANLSHGFLNR